MSKSVLAGFATFALLTLCTLHSWSQETSGPFLGITATDTDGSPKGALIVEVSSESPAKQAGFRRGDVILSISGSKIESNEQLLAEMKKLTAGKVATFEILRNGKEQTLTVAPIAKATKATQNESPFTGQKSFRLRIPNNGLDPRESLLRELQNQMQSGNRPMMGVMLAPLSEEIREKVGMKEGNGVAIADVEKNSPAEKAGLSATDVILEIDGQPVNSSPEVVEILQRRKAGDVVTLKVFRDGKTTQIKVTLENRTPTSDPFQAPFGGNSLLPPSGLGFGSPFDNFPSMTVPNRGDSSAANEKIRKLEKRVESLEATVHRMDAEIQRLKKSQQSAKEGK